MKRIAAALSGCFLVAAAVSAFAQAPDAVYTVASPGSTVRVDTFSLDGQPPTLYADLQGPLDDNLWFGSRWFAGNETTARFETFAGGAATGTDKFWFTIPTAQWEAKRAAGPWRIESLYSGVDLILVYGVGVGSFFTVPAGTVTFDVAAPIPEPGTYAMGAMGLVVLCGMLRAKRLRNA